MSGFTPLPLTLFRRMLRARGMTLEQLADQIERGRSHTSQVLWGHRDGGDTWPRIRAVVTDEEWRVLLRMEHCATWNSAQGDEGWLMFVECAWCRSPIAFRACVRAQTGGTSHGICPDCYTREIAALDQLAARQVERDVTAESFAEVASA